MKYIIYIYIYDVLDSSSHYFYTLNFLIAGPVPIIKKVPVIRTIIIREKVPFPVKGNNNTLYNVLEVNYINVATSIKYRGNGRLKYVLIQSKVFKEVDKKNIDLLMNLLILLMNLLI